MGKGSDPVLMILDECFQSSNSQMESFTKGSVLGMMSRRKLFLDELELHEKTLLLLLHKEGENLFGTTTVRIR